MGRFQRAFATSATWKMNTDNAVHVGNFQQQGHLLQSGGKSTRQLTSVTFSISYKEIQRTQIQLHLPEPHKEAEL